MYKDVISYKLAKNISEEHLLDVASEVVRNWMSKQSGFIKWEIHKNTDESYTDIVHWKSKDDAKKAEVDMANIPNAKDWYACYDNSSISSKHITHISTFE